MWAARSLWNDSIVEYSNYDESPVINEVSEIITRGIITFFGLYDWERIVIVQKKQAVQSAKNHLLKEFHLKETFQNQI